MPKNKPIKSKTVAPGKTAQKRVRKASRELADLTATLEAAGIIPLPVKDVTPESLGLRKALDELTYAMDKFLAACEENETSPCPEEEQDDDDRHPGEEWKEALAHARKLKLKRLGFSSSLRLFMPSDIEKVGHIFEKLRNATNASKKHFREHPQHVDTLSKVPPESPPS